MISSFNKGIYNVFPTKNVDIHELVTMIMFNSYKEKIFQIRDLREKNQEYKSLKKSLPYFTPNCMVKKRSLKKEEDFKKNFLEFSGYFFLDIDVSSDLPMFKKSIIEKYKDIATLICYSCSMGGVSILVKVTNSIAKENFHLIYDSIVSEYFKEEPIDPDTKDIGRAWFLTYDPDPYFNPDNSITLNEFTSYSKQKKGLTSFKTKEKEGKEPTEKGGNATYIYPYYTIYVEITPPNDDKDKMDLNNIQYKTSVPVEKPVVDVFEEYIVELKIPSYIPDGAKHKIFKAIIHQLVELNKDISEPDIYRFMYHVNSGRAVPPMDKRKLDTLIDFNIKEIRNNPDYSYSNYIKRCVHFNSNCSLPGQLKRAISSKLNGKMKNNESIEKIQLAKELMVKEGIKPTIKGIARITGLDRNTVRKNFNKPLNDLSKEVDKINEEYCIQGYYNTAISISGSINTHEQEVNKEFGKPRNIDLSTMDFYQNHTGSLGY